MASGSTVYFQIFDAAASPTFNVVSATISAVNKNPGTGRANSPFSGSVWSTGTVVATSTPSGPNGTQLNGPFNGTSSVGCNVSGKCWNVGPFTVGNFNGQKFEITINVLTKDSQQDQKTFTVDPEMVVGEGK